ncbi:MAG: aminoacyl-tRNA hydrolase [Alphaproteobacteria bacterium]|nr:aminoacyl-tRNA hydrolase [Alphaproteobacteria bacterium]
MLLLVGLGNPGETYQNHRHNIGFMAVDAIAGAHGFAPARLRFRGHVREGVLKGKSGAVKTLILKPMTFMNESGMAVQEAAAFHKVPLERILVVYDELDLAAGKVRVKRDGGNAGHNGLRSISSHVGNDFWRVRLGIGHPGEKERVTGHVLGNFTKTERAWLEPLLNAVADAAPYLADGDDGGFMNRVTVLTVPQKAPKPKPKDSAPLSKTEE